MSSRVFEGDLAGVSAVPWRKQVRRAVEELRPTPNNAEQLEELRELRAKVAHMSAEIEVRSREAWDHGLRAGEAAARQALEGDTRATVEKLCATIADVAAARADVLRQAEADTVRLSVEIARRVLHRELTVDSSALEGLIKAALIKLQQQEVYRVRVHPDLENLVRACLEQTGRGAGVEVINDTTQAPGGACFEISRGVLDASVDTQLREIERGLTDELQIRA